jgi:hypothetical protein
MSAISVAPRPSLTLAILNSYFDETSELMTYLVERLDPVGIDCGNILEYLLRDADSPSYRAFIGTTYIGLKTSTVGNNGNRRFAIYPPMMYMRDVSLTNIDRYCLRC